MKEQGSSSQSSFEPRIGLFWFIPSGSSFRFAGKSRPLVRVATIGGMKTLSDGHPEVWKALIKRDLSLGTYQYEFFPRGRVNWIEEGNQFLVLGDPVVFERELEKIVVRKFQLTGCNNRFLTDPHYRVNQLPTLLG